MAAFVNNEQIARLQNDLNSKRFDTKASVLYFKNQTLSRKNPMELRVRSKKENKMRLSECLSLNNNNENRRSYAVRSAPTDLMNCRLDDECASRGRVNERVIASNANNSLPRLTLKNWAEHQQVTNQIKDKLANALNKSKSSLSGFSLKSYDSEHKDKKNETSFQHCSFSSTTQSLKSSASLTEMINDIYVDQMKKLRNETIETEIVVETKSDYFSLEKINETTYLRETYACTLPMSSINLDEGSVGSLESVNL